MNGADDAPVIIRADQVENILLGASTSKNWPGLTVEDARRALEKAIELGIFEVKP
jgi:hypothetical protein